MRSYRQLRGMLLVVASLGAVMLVTYAGWGTRGVHGRDWIDGFYVGYLAGAALMGLLVGTAAVRIAHRPSSAPSRSRESVMLVLGLVLGLALMGGIQLAARALRDPTEPIAREQPIFEAHAREVAWARQAFVAAVTARDLLIADCGEWNHLPPDRMQKFIDAEREVRVKLAVATKFKDVHQTLLEMHRLILDAKEQCTRYQRVDGFTVRRACMVAGLFQARLLGLSFVPYREPSKTEIDDQIRGCGSLRGALPPPDGTSQLR
jgi:hypothetical protein